MSQTIPPASFSTLVQMLATQAMAALGKVPLPGQTEMKSDLAVAKHFIDLLGVLEEKTQGQLTVEEAGLLGAVAHELRIVYVAETK